MKHIGEFDKTEMVIALLEVLEIKGNNPVIEKVRSQSYVQLKEFLSNCDPEWLVGLMLRVRENLKEKK